jgi:hypothetical protein
MVARHKKHCRSIKPKGNKSLFGESKILDKSEQLQQQHKLHAKLRFCTPQEKKKKPKFRGSSIREANMKRKSIPEPTTLA